MGNILSSLSKTIHASLALAVFLFLSVLISSDSKEFEISKNVEIFISILDELNSNYVDDIKAGQIIRKGIDAMLESLDPYTVYYSESEVEDYQIQITGKYGGIGSLINKDSTHVFIAEPYEGFPAHKSGLRAGDRILAIGDKKYFVPSRCDLKVTPSF